MHQNFDFKYVVQVDAGCDMNGETTLQIVTGVAGNIPIQEKPGSLVVVFTNLKPCKMRGVLCHGALLAATKLNKSGALISYELVRPPEGSKIGERITIQGYERSPCYNLLCSEMKLHDKKRAWQKIKHLLQTNDKKQFCFKGLPFLTSAGELSVQTMTNVQVDVI